ncbi:TPA: hypothetical protein ACX6PM_002286 [Photobacterium damselae]
MYLFRQPNGVYYTRIATPLSLVTVKLEFAINESLQSRVARLAVGYDEAKEQLAETRAKLADYQDALHAPERKCDAEISRDDCNTNAD